MTFAALEYVTAFVRGVEGADALVETAARQFVLQEPEALDGELEALGREVYATLRPNMPEARSFAIARAVCNLVAERVAEIRSMGSGRA